MKSTRQPELEGCKPHPMKFKETPTVNASGTPLGLCEKCQGSGEICTAERTTFDKRTGAPTKESLPKFAGNLRAKRERGVYSSQQTLHGLSRRGPCHQGRSQVMSSWQHLIALPFTMWGKRPYDARLDTPTAQDIGPRVGLIMRAALFGGKAPPQTKHQNSRKTRGTGFSCDKATSLRSSLPKWRLLARQDHHADAAGRRAVRRSQRP